MKAEQHVQARPEHITLRLNQILKTLDESLKPYSKLIEQECDKFLVMSMPDPAKVASLISKIECLNALFSRTTITDVMLQIQANYSYLFHLEIEKRHSAAILTPVRNSFVGFPAPLVVVERYLQAKEGSKTYRAFKIAFDSIARDQGLVAQCTERARSCVEDLQGSMELLLTRGHDGDGKAVVLPIKLSRQVLTILKEIDKYFESNSFEMCMHKMSALIPFLNNFARQSRRLGRLANVTQLISSFFDEFINCFAM